VSSLQRHIGRMFDQQQTKIISSGDNKECSVFTAQNYTSPYHHANTNRSPHNTQWFSVSWTHDVLVKLKSKGWDRSDDDIMQLWHQISGYLSLYALTIPLPEPYCRTANKHLSLFITRTPGIANDVMYLVVGREWHKAY